MRPLAIPFRGRILGYPMVLFSRGAPQLLLLDSVTGAAAAYSLRKLRSAYAGSAVRVRRSSDNSEQDIGFSGNDFDTSAFSSFIGGGSGYVATWYDQSGNANNATQSTAANQAQIILSAQNGKPSLNFDGTNTVLDVPTAAISTTLFSVVLPCSARNVASLRFGFSAQAGGAVSARVYLANNGTDIYARAGGSGGDSGDIETATLSYNTFYIHLLTGGGGGLNSYINNGSASSGSFSNSGVDNVAIGAYRQGGFILNPYDGYIAETIVFDNVLSSTNRAATFANINVYYAIY